MDYIFQLNIPAELTITGSTKLYVFVSTSRFDNGRIGIDFVNLTTNIVCSVTDWQKVFSLAKERCHAYWSCSREEKLDDDLFLQLGQALNPVLNRQNLEACK